MKRTYLKLHLWLKAGCERLTLRQRKIILFSVSSIYFLCCIGLIIPVFIPEKNETNTEQTEIKTDETDQSIPELIDVPVRKDSLYGIEFFEQSTT
ncbi:MAG: hypothetical protein EOM44_04665 [Bacteroidia bacterium]|nr:hypothetical protein [Bacteroidia bacterium]